MSRRSIAERGAEIANQLKRSCDIQQLRLSPSASTHRKNIFYLAAIAVQLIREEDTYRINVRQLDPRVPVECLLRINSREIIITLHPSQVNREPLLTDEVLRAADSLAKDITFEVWLELSRRLCLYAFALFIIFYVGYNYSLLLAAFLLWLGSVLVKQWRTFQEKERLKLGRSRNHTAENGQE